MTPSVSAVWRAAPATGVSGVPQQSARSGRGLDNSSVLAGMLLAAALAALLAVADELIETWTDGHLLAGWVALWTLVFALLAMLASPLRRLAARLAAHLSQRVQHARMLRAEARMWEYASLDARTLADIRVMRTRANDGL